MSYRIKKNKGGITLIEALVSILILGITLVTMLGVFITARISAAKAKHHMEAMNHARAAMEEYIYSGTTYILPDGDIKDLNGNCPPPTVTDYDTDIKQVTVKITWDEVSIGGTQPTEETLVTLISE